MKRKSQRKSSLIVLVFVIQLLAITAFPVEAESYNVDDQRTVYATGTVGRGGAIWTLFDDGIVEIGGGIISHNSRYGSPWRRHSQLVQTIVFTEPVVAGEHLVGLFSFLPQLVAIENANYLDTTNVVDMSYMFEHAGRLTTVDVASWNTNNVVSMRRMFLGTSNLSTIDVSNWDTSNVETMHMMFVRTGLTELDVATWDTSNVISMISMFNGARIEHLDLANWNTENVTRMRSMFSGSHLITLDVSGWNTSNVWDMPFMFHNATQLRSVTVGADFRLNEYPHFRPITPNQYYTGYWQNVGTGTIENPQGEDVVGSRLLSNRINRLNTVDTFVWQPQPSTQNVPNHVVVWGDTLSELAVRFQTTVAELVQLNNITNPDLIFVNQILILP